MLTLTALEIPCYHNGCVPQRRMLGAAVVAAAVDDDGDVVESLWALMSTRSSDFHDHQRQVLRCCGCESRESQHWSEKRLSMSSMMEWSRFCGPSHGL